MNTDSRERLMREIQIYSFAVCEALLYLDAYPDSRAALDYYNKYRALEQKAMSEYERKYGPISAPDNASSWQWTEGPWPWQNEGKR